jgi:hypothetical protein
MLAQCGSGLNSFDGGYHGNIAAERFQINPKEALLKPNEFDVRMINWKYLDNLLLIYEYADKGVQPYGEDHYGDRDHRRPSHHA